MGRSLAETQAAVDSREFALWQAYYQLDPWGEERADLRAGIVASTVYAMGKGKGPSMKPRDFMPNFDRAAVDDAMIAARLQAWALGMKVAK